MSLRISRAVTPQDLADLLARATQANIAFVRPDGTVDASPVAFAYHDRRYLFSTGESGPQLDEGRRASLLIDEGCYHAELRGVRVRGAVRTVEREGATAGIRWLEVMPEKVVAWDYGGMHEVSQ